MSALQKLGVAAFEFMDNGREVMVHGSGGKLAASADDEVCCAVTVNATHISPVVLE